MAVGQCTLQRCLFGGRNKTSVTMLAASMLSTFLPYIYPTSGGTWWPDGQALSVYKPKRSGNDPDHSVKVPHDPRPTQGTGGSNHSLFAMQRGGTLCEPRAPTTSDPTAQFQERMTRKLFDDPDELALRCLEHTTEPLRSLTHPRGRGGVPNE